MKPFNFPSLEEESKIIVRPFIITKSQLLIQVENVSSIIIQLSAYATTNYILIPKYESNNIDSLVCSETESLVGIEPTAL